LGEHGGLVLEAVNREPGETSEELGTKEGEGIVYNCDVQVRRRSLAYPQAAVDMTMSGRVSGCVQEETLLAVEFEAG
jgi:hypothetical protein